LAKLARRQGQQFESAQWLHKAEELPFKVRWRLRELSTSPQQRQTDFNC
jgi:hypothetical protein